MAEKTSVVTSERFKLGLTYQDYIAQINVNKDEFQKAYTESKLAPEDAEFFKKAVAHPSGPAKMLVLGEDWCTDVYRELPMMARLAEASGIELRVFPRDANLDIMDEFLNRGEFKSIPVAVFYTMDHRYIDHWIERAEAANRELAELETEVRRERSDADDPTIRADVRVKARDQFPAWRQQSVAEMRKMIAQHLKME